MDIGHNVSWSWFIGVAGSLSHGTIGQWVSVTGQWTMGQCGIGQWGQWLTGPVGYWVMGQ